VRGRVIRGIVVIMLWPLALYIPFTVFTAAVLILHWFSPGDYSFLQGPVTSLGVLMLVASGFVGMRIVHGFLDSRYDWGLPLSANVVYLALGSVLALQSSRPITFVLTEFACLTAGVLAAVLYFSRGERRCRNAATT
jgi:hypothetical protein